MGRLIQAMRLWLQRLAGNHPWALRLSGGLISTILVLVPVGYVGNGASNAEDNGVGWCYEKSELTTATAVGAVGAIGNAIACVLFLIGGRAQTAATSGV